MLEDQESQFIKRIVQGSAANLILSAKRDDLDGWGSVVKDTRLC